MLLVCLPVPHPPPVLLLLLPVAPPPFDVTHVICVRALLIGASGWGSQRQARGCCTNMMEASAAAECPRQWRKSSRQPNWIGIGSSNGNWIGSGSGAGIQTRTSRRYECVQVIKSVVAGAGRCEVGGCTSSSLLVDKGSCGVAGWRVLEGWWKVMKVHCPSKALAPTTGTGPCCAQVVPGGTTMQPGPSQSVVNPLGSHW